LSTLDEFATTRNSSFSDADVMRFLTMGFDIVAGAPSSGSLFLTERTLQLIDKTRGLTLIDKSRSLQLI
jgi:hypothetical protein